jgi:small subunit ribosomal protein S9
MDKQTNTIGRRKEAVARIYVTKGTGAVTVNGKDYKKYFPLVYLQNQVESPLKVAESTDKFDINANLAGGGVKGQAEALKLAIARALCEINEEFRPALRAAGLMTRDPRGVQRKMFGHKKARRSYQFSKR